MTTPSSDTPPADVPEADWAEQALEADPLAEEGESGPRPANVVRLRELERACALSESRLRRAEREVAAETVRLRALAE